ncbi:hypothetical protein [Thiocapsa roseopersicina]|uniref:O-Antigen ligase n=1 Tax=Thiocapsa roseopersicina TaxID=1058 RepID=A0A1H2Y3U4_THIRO|nr:hypothetical protein [Thiocapsa roseopersicina]SDW99796.1 hypothetical protein SAMN05421783_11229 [Thiocapsa roseopersicina]
MTLSSPVRLLLTTVVLAAVGAGSVILALGLEGFTAKLSAPVLGLGAVGAFVASMLFFRPVVLLWLVTGFTLIVVGFSKYFLAGPAGVEWVSYGLAALMYLAAIAALIGGQTPLGSGNASSLVVSWLVAFVLVTLISWAMAPPGVRGLLVSLKGWAFFGGLWAFLALYPLSSSAIMAWLKGLLAIGLIQPVFAVYQWFVIGGQQRQAGLYFSPDSVTGTFGGKPDGGGLAPALGLFIVCGCLILVSFWRRSLISTRHVVMLSGVLLFPLALMEEKVLFFYIPVGLLVLYRDYIRERPVAFLFGSVLLAAALALLLSVYVALHWGEEEGRVQHMMGYSFAVEGGREDEGILTRTGAPVFWWRENSSAGLANLLFGYGIGASRTGGQSIGPVAEIYTPIFLDRTTLSGLLWDIGILGSVFFYGLLISGSIMGAKLASSPVLGPRELALAGGLTAIFPLFVMSSLYRNDIPSASPVMFMLMCAFGLLFWLHRKNLVKSNTTT